MLECGLNYKLELVFRHRRFSASERLNESVCLCNSELLSVVGLCKHTVVTEGHLVEFKYVSAGKKHIEQLDSQHVV